MANETLTSSISALLPSIIAEAMFQAQEASIMRQLVKTYSLPQGNGKTVTVPVYNKVSAADIAEGTDLANTEVTAGSAVLTVAEAGIMTTVSDLAARSASSNVVADTGILFGRAIAEKMDKDLIALFAGLNGGVKIGTGLALTAADIFKAVATLRARGLTVDGMVAVIGIEDAYNLKSSMTNTFADPAGDVGNDALRNGFVGRLAGIPVYESANVVGDGAVFHRDALGLAVMSDIAIEAQRDASLRATELVAVATYGVGELNDQYGVGLDANQTM